MKRYKSKFNFKEGDKFPNRDDGFGNAIYYLDTYEKMQSFIKNAGRTKWQMEEYVYNQYVADGFVFAGIVPFDNKKFLGKKDNKGVITVYDTEDREIKVCHTPEF